MRYHSECGKVRRRRRCVCRALSVAAGAVVGHRAIAIMIALSAVGATGCYSARSVPVRLIDEYPSRENVSRVTVAAEPFRGNQCAKVFNHWITWKGFLPMLIVARNDGAHSATLLGSEIRLRDETGQIHCRVRANVVADQFLRSPALEAYFLFGWLSFLNADQYNDELHADWAAKELGQRVIVHPHTTVHGFAYFELKGRPRGSSLEAVVPVIDETGEHRKISMALP